MIRTLLIAALLGPGAALAGALEHACEAARFTGPTERYAHCVLGDCSEWSGLELTLDQSGSASGSTTASITLPNSRVFEDLAPRCAPMGPKGEMWIVVVESAQGEGAQLAAYALDQTYDAPRLIKVA
ncbi:MAG: hypothetical protein AAGA78_11985, partial [Pseudomonadota bacterium]